MWLILVILILFFILVATIKRSSTSNRTNSNNNDIFLNIESNNQRFIENDNYDGQHHPHHPHEHHTLEAGGHSHDTSGQADSSVNSDSCGGGSSD